MRRRDKGRLERMKGYLPMAAIAFVVIALLAQALAPIAVWREINSMRARTAATSDRARAMATQLRLLFAEQVEHHEALRLHQTGSADQYRDARRREDASFDTLEKVSDRISPRFAKEVDSLRALAARWHRLPDGYLTGGVSAARFNAALPELIAQHESTLTALHGVETSIDASRTQYEARGGRMILRQRVILVTVGLLAVLGTGVVFWFARRDRALSRQLAIALDEEAHARAETERRRVELERVTESKTRLMRGFSHDVKNPLGAADGLMQLLEDGLMDPLTTRQMASVGRARRSLGVALRLIEDLLALARAESGELEVHREPVNLGEVARDATEEFRAQAEHKGLAIAVDDGDDGIVVQSDPARVRQVLSNLVSNAVKYTERGTITLRAFADGQRAAIEVADTGRGIPDDRQQLVFREFVRLDPYGSPGAGVGLAISQKIVQALGGEITMTSEAGRGSRFVLWLPLGDRP